MYSSAGNVWKYFLAGVGLFLFLLLLKFALPDDKIAAPVHETGTVHTVCDNCVDLSDLDDRYVRKDNSGSGSGSDSSTSQVQFREYSGTREGIKVTVASDSVLIVGGEEFTVGGKTYSGTVKTFEGGNTFTNISITNGFLIVGTHADANEKLDELKDKYDVS